MIPVRLQLRNFLSYGEGVEPLDFTGIHVACLSGNNGHGKSALLDAITWALWGQARTGSDDLVRLGQSSMQVEFDFRFDGHEYRVIRKRTRGKTGQSDLQFQIKNGDGSYRPLTEQGIRATQERIVQTLRLDYETFINSSFLMQGRADEFARRGPAERKKILGEILGLRIYDALMEAARQKARAAEARREALETELRRIETELANESAYRAERESVARENAEAETKLKLAQAEQERCQARKSELEALAAQRSDLAKRLDSARREIAELKSQHDAAQTRLSTAQAVLSRREAIERDMRELRQAREKLEELSSRADRLRRLDRDRSLLLAAIEKARAAIEGELKQAGADRQRLKEREQEKRELVEEIRRREEEIAGLECLEEERQNEQLALESLRQEEARIGEQVRQIEATLKEEAEKFDLLKGALAARCPVCEEPLAPEKRLELGRRLKRERQENERRLKEAQEAGAAVASQIAAKEQAVNAFWRQLQGERAAREQLARAQQRLEACEKALAELPALEARLAENQRLLAEGAFALAEREGLTALEKEIAALEYDEGEVRALKRRLQELATIEQEHAALQTATATLQTEQNYLAQLEEWIDAREAAVAEDAATQARLDTELEALPRVTEELRAAEAAREEAAALQKASARRLAVCDEKLEQCARLKEEAARKRVERTAAEKERLNYDDLARIFGRNGIPALIIENALPEIENEANQILSKLTENSLHIAFRTQRDLKNRSVTETLEIDISDEMGTRRLECFSGGESFRIHFAIRIALSRLLARRAGAPLQTLVIDEGFGSQDSEGRDRLVEAIRAVQDDFEKILVITHIDELKDAFPTRIEITKNHLGSQIHMI